MVLEQIYPISWLSQKKSYAFLLGITYAVLGIFSALLVLPKHLGLVSIAFTSLLLLPSINRLLALEENEPRIRSYNIFIILKQHMDVISIYFFMFIGTLVTFMFFTLFLPEMAQSLFFAKEATIIGALGGAIQITAAFKDIVINNLWVLVVMFIASFIYGAGSIFLLVWNASVWGFVFGLIAKNAAALSQGNPLAAFVIAVLAIIPHMIIEASAYFFVSVAGGVISKAAIRERLMHEKFVKIVIDGFLIFLISIVILIIAAYVEVNVAGKVIGFLIG